MQTRKAIGKTPENQPKWIGKKLKSTRKAANSNQQASAQKERMKNEAKDRVKERWSVFFWKSIMGCNEMCVCVVCIVGSPSPGLYGSQSIEQIRTFLMRPAAALHAK